MFNIPGNSNPEVVWSLLGTFYRHLPEEQKQQIQKYWEALAATNDAAWYSLYQSDVMQYPEEDKGWYETLYKSYDVIFEDLNGEGRENVTEKYLNPPKELQMKESSFTAGDDTATYVVSAVNNQGESVGSDELIVSDVDLTQSLSIQWNEVEGATSYRVYGRSPSDLKIIGTSNITEFEDTGQSQGEDEPLDSPTALVSYLFEIPGDLLYLYIPELIDSSEETLEYGEDFQLRGLTHIEFFAPIQVPTDHQRQVKRQTFLSEKGFAISPIIASFYFKVFGKEEPRNTFRRRRYDSKEPDLESKNDLDRALLYGKHLKFFTWAYSFFLRKAPTLSSLRSLYSLVKDYPFSYHQGVVTDISGSVITIESEEETVSYDIEDETKHAFSVNDPVNQFDILREGIIIEDFYSNKSLIEDKADQDDQLEFVIYLASPDIFNPDNDLISHFKSTAIPAGLKIIEETLD